MSILAGNMAALAVSLIFFTWRSYEEQLRLRRHGMLRERVAYMLWVMAQGKDNPSRELVIPRQSS